MKSVAGVLICLAVYDLRRDGGSTAITLPSVVIFFDLDGEVDAQVLTSIRSEQAVELCECYLAVDWEETF